MDFINVNHNVSISIFPKDIFVQYHKGIYHDCISFYTTEGVIMLGLKKGTAKQFAYMVTEAVKEEVNNAKF